jgi:AmpD protein
MIRLFHNNETGIIENVRQVPSPNFDERPENTRVDLLVVHAISLPPRSYGGSFIEDFFRNCLDCDAHPYFKEIANLQVSSHFLIDRTGLITQFVPTHCRAWHAGVSTFEGVESVNNFGIGIELEGCDEDMFELRQYESLVNLTRCLQEAYPEIHGNRIVGHSDISPERKTDPGPCFKWDTYRAMLDPKWPVSK